MPDSERRFDVLVAGHVCLDIIPALDGQVGFSPGKLVEAGPAVFSPGGAVSNVGTVLDRLGLRTAMVGKIGGDPLAKIVLELLDENAAGATKFIRVDPEETTSYTIVINLSGKDRMFLHSPGANRSFQSSDLPHAQIAQARVLHFGYPPLMRCIYSNEGAELVDIFRRAKQLGLLTSLDMSLPDEEAESGRVAWRSVLQNVLPFVDYFLPGIEELLFMLEVTPRGEVLHRRDATVRAAAEALAMGAKNVCLKLGSEGLFYTDGHSEWWQPCFPVQVKGTTGSGDATIAGFLCAVLEGRSIPASLTFASAVGACCCEASDAVSGVPCREEVDRRLELFLAS